LEKQEPFSWKLSEEKGKKDEWNDWSTQLKMVDFSAEKNILLAVLRISLSII
jgi:hypothetical protein